MNITLINTSDTGGGAPLACRRLMDALHASQADAKMLVQQKKSADKAVFGLFKGWLGKVRAELNFLGERLPFMFFQEKDKTVRFAFSEANFGANISKNPLVQQADILHLHWTNRGFLSIENLKQLFSLGKPIVWTLHDMWTFTGGCHYTGGCTHFEQNCGNCPILSNPSVNDLSKKGWLKKQELYQQAGNLHLVTCSNWLAGMAKTSSLLANFPVQAIPNPIDIDFYEAKDKNTARKKWGIATDAPILLFGAANINDKRKGLTYLLQALAHYKTHFGDELQVVMFGKNTSFNTEEIPFKVHSLPLITSQEELVELYSLADVFVQPSLEDNLPNMVMESLACATPVVAFNTGGLPDLVDHQQNGYLADFQSADDLAAGIHWVLSHPDRAVLQANARQKVVTHFNPATVADQYLSLYRSLLPGHE
ncbi:MAG: glycosyltransferase family 4 protein [Sphingobacteriaceae bacterium]